MNKWLKIGAAGVALVVLAGAAAVVAGTVLADRKMARKLQVRVAALAVAADAAAVDRGRYLFTSRGCIDCHGDNGAGRTFVEDDSGLRIRGPNISPGPGSVVAAYRTEDWVRAIRHGVAPGGRPLMVMPSEDYNRLTDADVAALIAYARSLPPASGGPAVVDLPLPARVLYGLGAIRDAADKIDHALPPAQPVPEGVTAQHGQYVANSCLGCHGPKLEGGRIPGGPPDWPPAANLTPAKGSEMGRYADVEAFIRMFRSGKRPDGSAIKVMPFKSLRLMSDTDLRALHLYLRSLPGRPAT